MDRVVRGRSATVYHTFYSDGTATDPSPDAATVTITRADGTALYTAAATTEEGTGTVSYTLTPADTSLLDTLTFVWKARFGGQDQTFPDTIEVAGDLLFTIAQARDALGDQTYDADKIAAARTYAETELENALGYALVPRYSRATLSGDYGRPLRLKPYVRSIRTVSVAGTALGSSDVAALTFDAGFLRGYRWPTGYSNVVVGYEHGLDYPPPGATQAALALALDYLGGPTDSGIDPRAESIVTVDGTIRLRTSGGPFGALGVNEWVTANRLIGIA